MTRNLWLGSALLILGLGSWLAVAWFERSQPKIPMGPSPIIRVLLQEKRTEVTVHADDGFDILVPGRSRPLPFLRKDGLDISIQPDHFLFAGFRPEVDRLDILSTSGTIKINGGTFKGHVSIHRTGPKQFITVLHTELEPYIARVVMGEMPHHWPTAALQAQAIAARSFAVYHLLKKSNRPYDLRGDARAQAFSRKKVKASCHDATASTQGQILWKAQQPLLAYYVSTCGGKTRAFKQGQMVYPSVTCEHCKSSPHFDWDVEVDLPLLKALMGSKWPSGAKLKSVELKKEAAGHAKTIMFIPDRGPALSLDALVFRRHINKVKGKEVIKSLRWKADVERGDLVLSGQGWGYHGIGLCQYGSEGKAEKGWSAQQILEAYYPEATIAPAPDLD